MYSLIQNIFKNIMIIFCYNIFLILLDNNYFISISVNNIIILLDRLIGIS